MDHTATKHLPQEIGGSFDLQQTFYHRDPFIFHSQQQWIDKRQDTLELTETRYAILYHGQRQTTTQLLEDREMDRKPKSERDG